MKQSKKVVLFLVEGITDETTLGLILSRHLPKDKLLRFHVIGGDLTTQMGTTTSNCINRLVDVVKDFLAKDFYQKSDLYEIVHLVDADGAFVPDELVLRDDSALPAGSHIYYTEDAILTDRVDSIVKRNQQKSEILTKLMHVKNVYGQIPYHIYFFSCNLEHVLYNRRNVPDRDKYQFAKEVMDEFVNQPEEFVAFLKSEEITSGLPYLSSWEELSKDNHSLLRDSNFALYFDGLSTMEQQQNE